MKRFFDLKIRTKLMVSFIVLLFLTLVVGAIGIYNMYLINTSSQNMYNNFTKPIEALEKTQTALESVGRNHILALYEQNTETLQSRLDVISAMAKQTDVLLKEYNITKKDDTATALYDTLITNLTQYRTLREENLTLIKNKQYDGAFATLSAVTLAREQANSDLQALVDYNSGLSEQVLQENASVFTFQLNVMLIIIAVTGILALSMGIAISSVISKPIAEIAKAADTIAQGDMNVHAKAKYKDEIGALANSFEQMVSNMNEVLSGVASSSEQVDSGAKQVSDSGMSLSQGSTEQASAVQQLTASLEEISSQTRLNAQNASQANELSIKAKVNADHGNTQMKDMVVAMESINTSSASISKIIKVIDDIAFQTNILALNAAVEAARAGQHGKGFAVVAEEVRNLAARSAKAAKETTNMIEDCIKKTAGGTKIANDTATALDMIVTGVDQVAELVNNIAIASNEQAIGIEQINQGLIQVSQVVQNNSATSEESAAASEELAGQANVLKEMVSRFKLRQYSTDLARYNGLWDGNRLNDLNPEVIAFLENMNERKGKMKAEGNSQREGFKKPRIVLSEHEFGKY